MCVSHNPAVVVRDLAVLSVLTTSELLSPLRVGPPPAWRTTTATLCNPPAPAAAPSLHAALVPPRTRCVTTLCILFVWRWWLCVWGGEGAKNHPEKGLNWALACTLGKTQKNGRKKKNNWELQLRICHEQSGDEC